MIHDANRCLCEPCMGYRARVKAARRRMGLRDLSLFSPVAAAVTSHVAGNRDAATGESTPSAVKQ